MMKYGKMLYELRESLQLLWNKNIVNSYCQCFIDCVVNVALDLH